MTTTHDSTPSPDASNDPRNSTELDLAIRFSDAVKSLAGIMSVIPYQALADAMHEKDVKDSVAQMINRRAIWAKMFKEIADDIENQYNRLMEQKKQVMEVMDLGNRAKRFFNDPQTDSMVKNLDMFLRCLRALHVMNVDGSLTKIVNALNNEVPPA